MPSHKQTKFVVPFVQWIHKINKLRCNVYVGVVKTRLTRTEPKPSDHTQNYFYLCLVIKIPFWKCLYTCITLFLWQPKHNSSSLDAFRTVLKFNDIGAFS